MQNGKHYLTGPHHYWTHFWFGIVVGAGIGWWIGAGIFDAGWLACLTGGVTSVVSGLLDGRQVDRFWHRLIGSFGS